MYLRKLCVNNFRCIKRLEIDFHEGLNILIGENDTGKTTILDSLRLCFGFSYEMREFYLTPDDFHSADLKTKESNIDFRLNFSDLSDEEQGIFIELLSITEDSQPELQLNIRFTYDSEKHRIRREVWGGQNEGQNIPFQVLDLIYFVYLGALRDANRDLSPTRANRLGKLFINPSSPS